MILMKNGKTRNYNLIKLVTFCLTLSSGMSFALCIFKSIKKLFESAKTPLALKESGKLPRYLPDTINGPSDERSGTWDGNTCQRNCRQNKPAGQTT